MRKALIIVEAYLRLIVHDAFMRKHDFAALHRQIKMFPLRTNKPNHSHTQLVSDALDIACVLYPRQVLCLQRSAVLVKMLRRHGVLAQMIIGAQKLPFKAHAWVEVDGQIVNDRLASRETFLILEVC
jgi:Transglutaminase-like superfamily